MVFCMHALCIHTRGVQPSENNNKLSVCGQTLHCCNYRRCFPDKRRYLWMLPGVLFAVAGAVMFALFETAKNYKYIHSAWHVCLSLSIVFLLPLRRKRKGDLALVS